MAAGGAFPPYRPSFAQGKKSRDDQDLIDILTMIVDVL